MTLPQIGFTAAGIYLVLSGSPFWALLLFGLAVSPAFVFSIILLFTFIVLISL